MKKPESGLELNLPIEMRWAWELMLRLLLGNKTQAMPLLFLRIRQDYCNKLAHYLPNNKDRRYIVNTVPRYNHKYLELQWPCLCQHHLYKTPPQSSKPSLCGLPGTNPGVEFLQDIELGVVVGAAVVLGVGVDIP